MAVGNVKRLAGPFTGVGTKILPFGFKIFEPTDVFVALAEKENDPPKNLEYNADYSVEMNQDQEATPGGTVTLTNALTETQIVSVGTDIPYTQTTQLTNYIRFPPETINAALDRTVVQIQQLVEQVSRAIITDPTDTITPRQLRDKLLAAVDDAVAAAGASKETLAACEAIKGLIERYSWDIPRLVNSLEEVEAYPYDGYFWVKGYGNPGNAGEDISNRLVGGETLGKLFNRLVAKASEFISVKDYGAVGDGQADDTKAFEAAIAQGKPLLVSSGSYVVGDLDITVPLSFLPGAALLAKSGSTVSLREQISSPKQHIFQGNGTYTIALTDAESGEQLKEGHCAWWGVFPGAAYADVNSDRIAKALSAYGNLREGVLYFDIGGYHLTKSVDVPRGVVIKGDGIRRTVFVPHSDGWPVFRTIGDAASFEDIQFETGRSGQAWQIKLRSSPAIQIETANCVVRNACFVCFENAISADGEAPIIEDVYFSIDTQDGDSSSAFLTLSRGYAYVNGVFCNLGKTYSPNAIVKIAPKAGSSVMRGLSINNVHSAVSGQAIYIDASANSIVGLLIRGISYSAISGNKPNSAITVAAANAKYVAAMSISDVVINNWPENVVSFSVASGGQIVQAALSNLSAFGSSSAGAGLVVTIPETAGGERIVATVGGCAVNRKTLISAPSDARVAIKQVTLA